MPSDYRITHVFTRIGGVAHELQRLHFAGFNRPSSAWQPMMNVYLRKDQLDICLDLAGVSPESIAIHSNGLRLVISGTRRPPDLDIEEIRTSCRQILAMEIESGRFKRTLQLPVPVDENRISTESKNGMLWIHLPVLRQPREDSHE